MMNQMGRQERAPHFSSDYFLNPREEYSDK